MKNIINRFKVKRLKKFGRTVSTHQFRLTLCDPNQELLAYLVQEFADYEQVEIVEGNLIHISCDALVSPANSFGDMGGGVDKVIDDYFEGKAQQAIQQKIRDEWYGELPVGMAVIVEPIPQKKPVIISTPTMRIPGNIQGTLNVYLAMRAMLLTAYRANLIHVACPGLGTGVGGIPYDEAAHQMKVAFQMIIMEEWKNIIHPLQAPFALASQQKRWNQNILNKE
jgi:O-acetyl-ADP-ribose deacetylase (regulator of RNase III)